MTSSKATLLELAARCEREEPTQKLCEDIALAIGWKVRSDIHRWQAPNGRYEYSAPLFSYSLDAAVTLVGDGIQWSITNLYSVAHAEVGLNLSDSAGWQNGDHRGGHMALALCAAALRARAEMGES